MLATTNRKWLFSLSLAGIVLILALFGGNWGRDYSAMASVAAPHIDTIFPQGIPVRTLPKDEVIVINGTNFGTKDDTGVRFTGVGYDGMLYPMFISSSVISLNIPYALLTFPNVYDVIVYTSSKPSIPTIPLWPAYDVPSNTVTFTVFEPTSSFLPIINK